MKTSAVVNPQCIRQHLHPGYYKLIHILHTTLFLSAHAVNYLYTLVFLWQIITTPPVSSPAHQQLFYPL